ncbi:hypothetical protein K0U27_01895 [archaeon]|nr:hypothetical protein [archaeon]
MKTRFLIIIGIFSIIMLFIFAVMWPKYGMVCNNAVVEHLQKYSNVFDDDITYDTYGIEGIGFPFGVHEWNVKECVDFTLEKRTSIELEKNTDPDKIEILQISKNKILSKGTGFDLPEDTFTQEDLKQLQQKEKELNTIADDPGTLEEKRRQIHLEIQEMQNRLQYPFQTGVPYPLVIMLQEKYSIFKEHRPDLKGVIGVTLSGPNEISHVHHALRLGIHPDHFTLSELESQDKKIREYLGNEMNILYEPALGQIPIGK